MNLKLLAHKNTKDPILQQYLQEIQRIPRLTRSEEKALLLITPRDTETQKKLINANLRFVVFIAKKYQGYCTPSLQFLDIIQEGNIGLAKAVENYNASKYPDFRLANYAKWWIQQGITRAFAQKAQDIRLPIKQAQLLIKIQKALEKRPAQKGPLRLNEIAEPLGITIKQLALLLPYLSPVLSLENAGQLDEGQTLLELIADTQYLRPENELLQTVKKQTIYMALNKLKLSDRERKVITGRFGLNNTSEYTLKELGLQLGISPEAIRQIETKILSRLRRDQKLNEVHAK